LFVKENPYLDEMTKTGADVISLGSRHDLAQARAAYPQLVFQGNVNEQIMRRGTVADVEAEVKRVVAAGGGQRHVINLSHGCSPEMPVANFEAYIRAAKVSF
jgi:uroporphyrinogen decarboxylase